MYYTHTHVFRVWPQPLVLHLQSWWAALAPQGAPHDEQPPGGGAHRGVYCKSCAQYYSGLRRGVPRRGGKGCIMYICSFKCLRQSVSICVNLSVSWHFTYVTMVTITSLLQTRTIPYGTQWHPEKNTFEWTTKEGINHSEHAVMITQTAANFFVSEGECLICCTHSPMSFR